VPASCRLQRTNVVMLKLLAISRNAIVVICGVTLFQESVSPIQARLHVGYMSVTARGLPRVGYMSVTWRAACFESVTCRLVTAHLPIVFAGGRVQYFPLLFCGLQLLAAQGCWPLRRHVIRECSRVAMAYQSGAMGSS
jgi:hypothetical protein